MDGRANALMDWMMVDFLFICLSIYLIVYLSNYLCVYLSVCLSLCLSICLSIHLSSCLFIHLPMCKLENNATLPDVLKNLDLKTKRQSVSARLPSLTMSYNTLLYTIAYIILYYTIVNQIILHNMIWHKRFPSTIFYLIN